MPFPWNRSRSTKPEPESQPFATKAGTKFRSSDQPTDPPLHAKPVDPEAWVGADEATNERTVRAGFTQAAKRYLARIPMAEDVVAMYFCLLDNRTPYWVKGVAAAALAYFVLPLDAIPDILPIIGLSDDIGVLSAALATVSTHLTPEHRSKAASWLRDERIIDVTPA